MPTIRRTPLPLSPLVLAGWLAFCLLAFGLAYALGYATTSTRPTLRAATPLPAGDPASELTGLFRAEALPPLTHMREHHAAGTPVPISGTSVPRGADRAAGTRAVAPFVLRYRTRALASSVQVLELGLSGLEQGSNVELRCLRSCTISERLAVGSGGRATSRRLRGWLRRGALVEVRARRPGWIGVHVTIRVTGLPAGLIVGRACLPPRGPQTPVSCRSLGAR